MNYEDWLKTVRTDAKFRDSQKKSTVLALQAKRFSNFVIADVTSQIRRGKNINEIIAELQAGYNIPKNRLKEFSSYIQKEVLKYTEFRVNSGRDLGVTLNDNEFQRISALLNFEQTAQQQAALDAAKTLEKAQKIPSIQRVLANGGGAHQIEALMRSGGLQYHAITEARLALQQFNSLYTLSVSDQAGISTFEYYGPENEKNRPLCAALVGNWFTKSQLEGMLNGTGYPVLHYCGGPNCQHQILGVPNQFAAQNPEKLNVRFEFIRIGEGLKKPFQVYTTSEKAAQLKNDLAA